jgi:hypothetical protein
MGEIGKIKLFLEQFVSRNGHPSLLVQAVKDCQVPFQYPVDPAHGAEGHSRLPVVVRVSALIAAELFVGTAMQNITALQTPSLWQHRGLHLLGVNIVWRPNCLTKYTLFVNNKPV